jgi:ribokinase
MRMTNAHASYLLVEAGRKVEAQSIEQYIGGGAVNAAVSMARLGGRVATLVKLGTDLNATKILERLATEGIAADFVIRTDSMATGAAVMISSHDHNAAIFTARGSNTTLVEADLADEAFERSLVYVTGLSNDSADRFPAILTKARKAGAFVACNPGIRQLSSRAQPFFENLPNIDLLSVNRIEAAQMVPGLIARGYDADGPPLPGASPEQELAVLGLEAGGFRMGLAAFMAAIRDCGPKTVLITDGGFGAFAADGDGIHHCGTVPVTVAGTAGAGDAYASTFSFSVANGSGTPDAMRAAALNAASVIEQIDTQGGLLDGAALKERIADSKLDVRSWSTSFG